MGESGRDGGGFPGERRRVPLVYSIYLLPSPKIKADTAFGAVSSAMVSTLSS